MATLRTVVIVGASLAGLRAAETLRHEGYDGQIVFIGDEPHLPYDRPPLSKELLAGEWEPEQITLRKQPYDDLDLDIRLRCRATGLDVVERAVELEGDQRLAFDGLVIATGARPRTLPDTPPLDGIFVLRTLDDCLAIRARLNARPRVVVIGAGFIGSEVAATCRGRGLDVTVLEMLPVPMARGVGPVIGDVCGQLHRDHSVDLRCGTCVAAPGIVAAGDVARWPNPLFDGESMRVEHWTNATEQGVAAARRLLAGDAEAEPFAPVPFVWSDQYDEKIQVVGCIHADDEVVVADGSFAERRFVALYGRDDRLVAALGFSRPRLVMQYRRMIAERASWKDALARASGE